MNDISALKSASSSSAKASEYGYICPDMTLAGLPHQTVETVKDMGKWVGSVLHKDQEKQIDLGGRIIGHLDSTTALVPTLFKSMSILSEWFPKAFDWTNWSHLSGLITLPYGILYLMIATVEIVVETVGIVRIYNLLRAIKFKESSPESSVLNGLQHLKEHYFNLTDKDRIHFDKYIERVTALGVEDEKIGPQFHEIKEKTLAIKYAALSRRISGWAAKEVSENIDTLIAKLSTGSDPTAEACLKGVALLRMVRIQAYKKLAIHIVALTAIAFFVIAMGLVLAATPVGHAVLILTAIGVLVYVLRFILEKRVFTSRIGTP